MSVKTNQNPQEENNLSLTSRKEFKHYPPSPEYKEVEMAKKKRGSRKQRNVRNAIGWGALVYGTYLLLVFFDIIPFTSRFRILDTKQEIIIISIILILLGVIINDKIRNVFKR